MRRRKAWVWTGLDETDPFDIKQGAGGSWQWQPDPEEPQVIHLPRGGTHEVKKPGRERIGFGKG